jgi:hypothetical protein
VELMTGAHASIGADTGCSNCPKGNVAAFDAFPALQALWPAESDHERWVAS